MNMNDVKKAYQMGAQYVLTRMEDKLFYVPEAWKHDEHSRIIYDIVNHVIREIREELEAIDG